MGSRRSKKVLVTGATGFLGAHVVSTLINSGFESAALARPKSNISRLVFLCPDLPSGNIFRADLLDTQSLRSVINTFRPDTVIHCAAYGVNYDEQDPAQAYATNTQGTVGLLATCEGTSVRSFINIGSSYEYGNQPGAINLATPLQPCNLYGKSKLEQFRAVAKYLAQSDLNIVHVRPFTMFGPAEGDHKFVALVVNRLCRGEHVDLTPGEQLRNYVYVCDVARYLCDMEVASSRTLIQVNLYSQDNLSLRQFGTLLADQFEHSGTLNWGGRPYRREEIMYNYADNATPVLLNPTRIGAAIIETIEGNKSLNNA